MFQYQSIRQGNDVETVQVEDASSDLFFMETAFIRHSDKVISSDKHINLGHYYLWMFTLPIPKIIIGEVPAVSASFEMSEIIIGEKIGSKRFLC